MSGKKFVNVIKSNPMQTTAAGSSAIAAMGYTHDKLIGTADEQTSRNNALAGGGGTYVIPQSADGAGGVSGYGPNSANANMQNIIVKSNNAGAQTQYDSEVAKPGTLHQSSAGPGPVVAGPGATSAQKGGFSGINAYYGICGPSCPYFGGKPQYSGGRRKKRKTKQKTKRKTRRRNGRKKRGTGKRRRRNRRTRRVRRTRRTRRGGRPTNTKCKLYDVSKLITPSYPIYQY